jgi:RNA polymerase sigma factor (sigma-70 family)
MHKFSKIDSSCGALLLRYYDCDDDAFNQYSALVMPFLLATAYWELPGSISGRLQAAEDCAQTTLLKVLGTKGRPTTRWNPRLNECKHATWLFSIHRRVIYDYGNRSGIRNERVDVDLDPKFPEDDVPEPGPFPGSQRGDRKIGSSPVDEAYMREVFRIWFERLSDGQRDVVVLRCWCGFSNEEVAEIGISESTASTHYRRALRLLKKLLDLPEYE